MPLIIDNKTCFAWDEGNICWDDNPFCWDEVCLVQEVAQGAGIAGTWEGGYQRLTKEKKRKFIQLICRVKGEKEYNDKKEQLDYKVTAKDVKMVVQQVHNVQIGLVEGNTVENKRSDLVTCPSCGYRFHTDDEHKH